MTTPNVRKVKPFSALLAATLLLAGCASPEPSTDPPPGVSVSLGQWRSDEPVHAIEVAVRNTTQTPVYFDDAQLITPSFKTLPPQKTDGLIRHTDRTDLRIQYGAANCLPSSLPTVQPATVVANLRVGNEQALRKVVFKIPHPDPLLARLLRDECSEYLIKEAADIEFGDDWHQVGKAMVGSLVLTRKGKGTVAINEVDGTTHFTPDRAKTRPAAVLREGQQELRFTVRMTPAACVSHAFMEAKKAFLFPVRATVNGGPERVVIVVPPKELQNRMWSYALKVCGLVT